MNEFVQNIKEKKYILIIKNLLSSKFFPFVLIPISLLCYYLSLDMVMIYVIGILGTLIFILLDDLSPAISVFLFMAVLVSVKNSPLIFTDYTTGFYFKVAHLVQIFIVIAVFSASLMYRAILNIIRKKFSINPIFLSLCAFAVVLLLNGMFSKNYTTKNMLYGLVMALCFCGIFTAIKDNLFLNKNSFIKVAYGFFAFSIVLVVELLVKYLTTEKIMVDGTISRQLLTFGWGIWNTMGMYLVLCIPFVIYLAGKEKLGFIFAIASVVIFVACIMSCSRQSIMGALIAYPLSLLLLFIKGKNRLKNATMMLIVVGILIIVLLTYDYNLFKYFTELFKKIIVDGEFIGNGRMQIWEEALIHFKSSPIFGVGFYVEMSAGHFSGLNFIPIMAHNTIMQLLSSCGIFGIIIYLSHRALTCLSYFKNITVERTYLAIVLTVFLLICLFDNHIFNIFPTIIYSCLIALLVASEKRQKTTNLGKTYKIE